MKRAVILGAGASKSYDKSATGIRMPVALDFFQTFRKLEIYTNPWVLYGNIITYIAERDKKDVLKFLNYNEDIEQLHSEIQEKLYTALRRGNFFSEEYDMRLVKAYTELIFVFTSVINEIQNGEPSTAHRHLAKQLSLQDTVITFNWDTLMDRALKIETGWELDDGYAVHPTAIFRDGWLGNAGGHSLKSVPSLLKLHGSSNWLTSYHQPGPDGHMELSQETKSEDFYVFDYATKPYATFAGRYMAGYEELSFGYYPPNLPLKGKDAPDGYIQVNARLKNPYMPEGSSSDEGLPSMPLIIPPVKTKEYDLFGTLFKQIWDKAGQEIESADEIYLIGYSFPKTDIRTDQLFKNAFVKRTTIPRIIILNPNPDLIYERFLYDYGIPASHISVRKEYFDEKFTFNH